ncbi:hypothetical protein [Bacillus sinesaloumensis]|nr:hypothetical protein [Bacillus sinesaloumensis]
MNLYKKANSFYNKLIQALFILAIFFNSDATVLIEQSLPFVDQ